MSHTTDDRFEARLLDLAYGELPAREARQVEAHVEGCETCRAELARIRETRRLMSALPELEAPERGERVLSAAAREAVEHRRAPARLLPSWLWGVSVTAVAIVAAGAVSYRIISMRPALLGADDPDALLGRAPVGETRESGPPEDEAPPPSTGEPQADAIAQAPAEPAPPRASAPEPPPRAAKRRAASPPERLERDEAEVAAAAPAAPEPSASPSASAPAPAPRDSAAGRAASKRAAPSAAPSAEPSAAESRAETRAAAPAEAAEDAAPHDPVARYDALRAAGQLRGAIRTFPGCEGEAWRKVEVDPDGRVVAYVREGRIGGRSVRVEQVYAEDGRLARTVLRDLDDPRAQVDADALGVALPSRAADAALDAPPRCGP